MANLPIKQSIRTVNAFVSRNAIPIFTGLTIIGLTGSVISAFKGAPLAIDNLDAAREEKGEDLTAWEIIQETWQPMLPTMIWCGFTIGIVVTNGRVNWKRQVALSSALSMADLALKEYQGKVVEMFGQSKHTKVKEEIAKDRMAKDDADPEPTQVIFTGRGDYLCKDNYSGQYFYSTQEAVKRTMYKLDSALSTEMFIGVNDLYYDLGIEPVKYGDLMGWNAEDGDMNVTFYTEYSAKHHAPCLVVDYDVTEKIRYGK